MTKALKPTISFPDAARTALADTQLRRNLGHATHTIRAKRAGVVAELADWEQLREAGRAIKERTLRHLDEYLLELEESVTRAGGVVHWARDAEECNRIVGDLVAAHGVDEVVKSKSLTTEETGLNEALQARGIHPWETDLAQLIIQLSDDMPSHILVPAIHKNRAQIRDLFRRALPGAPPEPAPAVPGGQGGHQRRQLRRGADGVGCGR
jgi:L-lactate dehydrogenase complex protein LldF